MEGFALLDSVWEPLTNMRGYESKIEKKIEYSEAFCSLSRLVSHFDLLGQSAAGWRSAFSHISMWRCVEPLSKMRGCYSKRRNVAYSVGLCFLSQLVSHADFWGPVGRGREVCLLTYIHVEGFAFPDSVWEPLTNTKGCYSKTERSIIRHIMLSISVGFTR